MSKSASPLSRPYFRPLSRRSLNVRGTLFVPYAKTRLVIVPYSPQLVGVVHVLGCPACEMDLQRPLQDLTASRNCTSALRPLAYIKFLVALSTFALQPAPTYGVNNVSSLIKSPITFSRISFTSTTCTWILTSLTLDDYPPEMTSGDAPLRVLDSSAVTFNKPTNPGSCGKGYLTIADTGIPANETAAVTSYTLFLRVARTLLPRRFYSFSGAPVASAITACPTSPTASVPKLALTSLLLFTPKGNSTTISTFASSGSSADPNTERLLAEGVLYVAAEFRVPEGEEPLRNPNEKSNSEGVTQFHCFLATDPRAANAAAESGVDARNDGGAEDASEDSGAGGGIDDVLRDSGARRTLSAGEAVGIAGGTVVAAVTVVTIFVSRRKRSGVSERPPPALPHL